MQHPQHKNKQEAGSSRLPASMRAEEYARLKELLLQLKPETTLEIGMANGESSLVICEVLNQLGRGKHIAIDPFESSPTGWAGRGIEKIRQAGLSHCFELLEEFDYLALPCLVAEQKSFDFILIDGWHSFDYTFIDLFYADLLLKPGGILVLHDTGWPAVYKACRFLETHKRYDRISPPIAVTIPSLIGRISRRIRQILGGPKTYREARRRRTEWYSLGAYRKRENYQVPNDFFVEF